MGFVSWIRLPTAGQQGCGGEAMLGVDVLSIAQG